MISDRKLSEELDRVALQLAGVARLRREDEAPIEITNAYVDLIFALGHAWLGARDRATTLAGNARAALVGRSSDVVHAWLSRACATRVQQWLAGGIEDLPLPASLAHERAACDRVNRYKIDRFREGARMLEPFHMPDAIAAFSRMIADEDSSPRSVVGAELSGFASVDAALASLAGAPPNEVSRGLYECISAAGLLSESEAMSIVVRASRAMTAACPPRVDAAGAALRVCARFGWGELVPELLAMLESDLPTTRHSHHTCRAVSAALRGLRRLGLYDEMLELIVVAEESLPEHPELTINNAAEELRYVLAGAAAGVGDRAANQMLENAVRKPLGSDAERLVSHRQLAIAFAHDEPARALARLGGLAPALEGLRNDYATSTHFAFGVICFVDAVVHAITTLSVTRG